MTDYAVNEWTRDDLPDHDVIRDVDDMHGNGMRSRVIDLALDTVVGHLNANHQKPGTGRWRRAHEIVEAERDQARESFRRLCDETNFDPFPVRDQLKQCRGEREQMTRDRDKWRARAEAAARELADEYSEANQKAAAWDRLAAHPALKMDLLPEADHTYAGRVFERITWLAEAAEARTAPAVTKSEIEQAVHGWVITDELVDAVWSLVSGDDPAVYVVRESAIAAVEVKP